MTSNDIENIGEYNYSQLKFHKLWHSTFMTCTTTSSTLRFFGLQNLRLFEKCKLCCVWTFQDDCGDFINKLKAVTKSELSKVHVD